MRNPFRDKKNILQVIEHIRNLGISRRINIMEVCGTHTYTYFRFGLRKIMPENVNLISGPGCPVCITQAPFIDKAIYLAGDKNNIIVTFGDLLKVKGSASSLQAARAEGANIVFVYSPQEAVRIAALNPGKRVIFLGVGFETTAPTTALAIKEAKTKGIRNFFLLSNHRLIPPAMEIMCKDKNMLVEGFLCPGHVSVIIGQEPYRVIVEKYKKGCVVCGFEPLDMVVSIYKLLLQIKNNKPALENEYGRAVKKNGNPIARKIISEVFRIEDAGWRGLGVIKKSGLGLSVKYASLDAQRLLAGKRFEEKNPGNKCLCAEVIKGKTRPNGCPMFKKICNPDNPLGPCMVSFEGSCRIYYEYAG